MITVRDANPKGEIGSHSSDNRVDLLPTNTPGDLFAIAAGLAVPAVRATASVRDFEVRLARMLGPGTVKTFSAGRVALAAILHALGIGSGDEVIIPGYTCVAVPNPILFRGATPIYADIDPETLNISVNTVKSRISSRTKAIVVQHTFGYPAPMKSLIGFADDYGIPIIEDCTHALGATLTGRPVGSFGHASFFSCEQTKIISTGTGGAAYTQDNRLAELIREFQGGCSVPSPNAVRRTMVYLAYAAFFRQARLAKYVPHLDYYLERLRLMKTPRSTSEEMRCEKPADFEMRWSGAQARIGVAQLKALPRNIEKRRSIAGVYFSAFSGTRIRTFAPNDDSEPAYVRFPIVVRDKAAFAAALDMEGVQAGVWFTAPVHPAEVPQSRAGYQWGSCPNSEFAVAKVANLPCHPRMTESDAWRIANVVLRCRYA
jgi:dTDP-4-amino-4,6-dideoxygalactose transaminase